MGLKPAIRKCIIGVDIGCGIKICLIGARSSMKEITIATLNEALGNRWICSIYHLHRSAFWRGLSPGPELPEIFGVEQQEDV